MCDLSARAGLVVSRVPLGQRSDGLCLSVSGFERLACRAHVCRLSSQASLIPGYSVSQ